jgi:hypothetical protein
MGRDDDECTICLPSAVSSSVVDHQAGWIVVFERTGTAFVVRVATRGVSGSGKRGPEAGGGLDSETGFRSAGAMAG